VGIVSQTSTPKGGHRQCVTMGGQPRGGWGLVEVEKVGARQPSGSAGLARQRQDGLSSGAPRACQWGERRHLSVDMDNKK